MSTGEGLLSSSEGPSSPKAEVMLYLVGRDRARVVFQQSMRHSGRPDTHITKASNLGNDYCHSV